MQGEIVTPRVPNMTCAAPGSGELLTPHSGNPDGPAVGATYLGTRTSSEPVNVATSLHRYGRLDLGSAGMSPCTTVPRRARDGASSAVLHVSLRDATARRCPGQLVGPSLDRAREAPRPGGSERGLDACLTVWRCGRVNTSSYRHLDPLPNGPFRRGIALAGSAYDAAHVPR